VAQEHLERRCARRLMVERVNERASTITIERDHNAVIQRRKIADDGRLSRGRDRMPGDEHP